MEKYHTKYQTKTTKKQFQLINKHNYYVSNMSNHVGKSNISSQSYPILQKNLLCQGRILFGSQLLSQQFACSHHTLITAIINSYQSQSIIKVGEDLCLDYKIQLGLFQGEINISELIHIHRQDIPAQQTPRITTKKSYQIELYGTSLAKEQNFNYCIYILHCCNKKQNNEKKLQWENFIEKFQNKNNHLFYSASLFCILQPTILSISNPLRNYKKLFQLYFHRERLNGIVGDSLRRLKVLQLPLKQINDPAYNEQHIKVNKIPSEYYFKFQHVKKMFCNRNDLSENDICRFLISNNFSTDNTINNINTYLNWKQNMILKYKLQDFQQVIDKNIWFYLGEDYHGRPVLLNKAANVKIKQLNEQLYCLYYQYWLQIYITSKMRGHVSQFLVICDVNDLSFGNFKLSITQRNISQNLLYSPQRQYKLIAINVGVFATYFWNILKPIVPEKTQQKIEIVGDDKQSIYACLSKEMDIDVIPQYLGGKKEIQNSIIQKFFD